LALSYPPVLTSPILPPASTPPTTYPITTRAFCPNPLFRPTLFLLVYLHLIAWVALTDSSFFVINLNFPAKYYPSLESPQPPACGRARFHFLSVWDNSMRILCSVFKTTNIWPREKRPKKAQDRPSLGGCVRTIKTNKQNSENGKHSKLKVFHWPASADTNSAMWE